MRRPLPARFTGHPRMSSGYGYVFTRLAKSEARSIGHLKKSTVDNSPKATQTVRFYLAHQGPSAASFQGHTRTLSR
jgi:hypothetical protein